MEMGPTRLIIKRGEYGAALFDGEHVFALPAYPLADVFDPTGAGDTFAGGFMGYLAQAGRVDNDVMRQAMVMGSVMASFTVEKFSLDRLREVTPAEISARFGAFKRLTHFADLDWK